MKSALFDLYFKIKTYIVGYYWKITKKKDNTDFIYEDD